MCYDQPLGRKPITLVEHHVQPHSFINFKCSALQFGRTFSSFRSEFVEKFLSISKDERCEWKRVRNQSVALHSDNLCATNSKASVPCVEDTMGRDPVWYGKETKQWQSTPHQWQTNGNRPSIIPPYWGSLRSLFEQKHEASPMKSFWASKTRFAKTFKNSSLTTKQSLPSFFA